MADTVDQQVTSQTPATKQKNPKRVAAGKLVTQRMKQAREAQKKALIEAQSIVAKNDLKRVVPPADAPSTDPPPSTEPQPSTKNDLTTTQWLSVISIIVSLAGIYYKREEIKSVFTPSPVLPRAPPPSPVDAAPQAPIRKAGIRNMD